MVVETRIHVVNCKLWIYSITNVTFLNNVHNNSSTKTSAMKLEKNERVKESPDTVSWKFIVHKDKMETV